jgi:effector-binding domain-containing protein
MLLLRRAEQMNQLREEEERLHRLEALIRLIDLEGRMTNDVILKNLPAQWIVSVRETIPAYRAVGQLIGRLYGSIGPLGIQGTGVVLLHDSEHKENDVDAEAGIYLKQAATVQEPFKCYSLPPATVASVVHHGAFNRIAEAYTSLLRWVEINGYHPDGPTREIFLHVSMPVSRDDESNVTEIQVPVQKG